MAEFATPLTTDQDIFDFEPSLEGTMAIPGKVSHLHDAASDDVARALRVRWWADIVRGAVPSPYQGTYSEQVSTNELRTLDGMDTGRLSRTQLHRLAIFRLLGWHIWPRFDTHNDEATYPIKRAKHWKEKFDEELNDILRNGVGYDWNEDGVAELYQEAYLGRRGTVRLERE
jgi:hypothetical protein